MVKNVLVITLGAGAGACLRWVLSMLLNSIFPAIPLGTVAANFIGGFGIGLSLGVFNAMPGLAPIEPPRSTETWSRQTWDGKDGD